MHIRTLKLSILCAVFLALSARAQTPPQLDMFGNLTGLTCPASASWINTTVTSGAITGSLTAQTITLSNATGVATGNWLTVDGGAAPVTVTGESLGTIATGVVQYKVTLVHGNYLPGTAVLKVNGVAVAEDQGALTSPPLAGQLQTGILTDIGLVTTGTSNGAMAISTGAASDPTPYENFLSVQWANPTPALNHTAVQEFINIVFTSGFVAAHIGQAITMDYKYSPAEMFVVQTVAGANVTGIFMNSHPANAPITQGTWYDTKVNVGTTPTWVFCDPLGFGNDDFSLYQVNTDQTSGSHMSNTVNTTAPTAITTTGSPVAVTPVSMAGICDQCYLTFDQGTASEETQQVTVSGSTFTFTPAKTHLANFTVKGYYYNGVAFGTCLTNGGCGAPLGGTSGGKYYGNVAFWGPMQIVRMRGWGYNALQSFQELRTDPLATVTGGGTVPWPTADHSQIAKMPLEVTIDAARASTKNGISSQVAGCGGGVAGANGNTDFAVKNVWSSFNGVITGAQPGQLFAGQSFSDLYDLNSYAYLCGTLKTGFAGLTSNQESPWTLFLMEDETDYLDSFNDVNTTGFSASDGTFEDYGSRKAMFLPPHISTSKAADTGVALAFSNNTNNLKAAMIATLQTEYTTIAALNTAWGSSYDNFGTDGTQVTGAALSPLPDGTTTTFTVTLAHAPDRESIQLFGSLAAGVAPILGGDEPGGGCGFNHGCDTGGSFPYTATGIFAGVSTSNISSSSITYSTGAISVTFSVAPAASASALTVNYWWGGWGVGHGLADEDGTCPAFTATCATVYGTSSTNLLSDGNAAFQSDMVTLLGNMAAFYSSHEATQYRALMPHTMITTGYSTGGHGAPTDLSVYQNYCPNVDILGISGFSTVGVNSGGLGTQGINRYQYANKYCGDKPTVQWSGNHADPGSVMSLRGCVGNIVDLPDQTSRAAEFAMWVSQLGALGTFTGTDTWTGINTWDFEDLYSECTNWGEVSAEDNPYDGVHATTSGTPEKIGNNALAYTPELNNWGDLINPVRIDFVNQENTLLGATPPPTFPVAPSIKSIIWGMSIINRRNNEAIRSSSSSTLHRP